MNQAKKLILSQRNTVDYVSLITDTFGADLLAYWPLDDATGTTARDASGNSRTGTISGGVTLNQAGKYGRSFYFDGVDGAVMGNAAYNAGFPISEGSLVLWFKADAADTTNRQIYFSRVDASNYISVQLGASSQTTFTYRRDGTSYTAGLSSLDPSDDWYHIVCTWSVSNTRTRLYVNAVKTSTDGSPPDALIGAIGGAGLGSYALAYEYGNAQHVALINREITQAEVDIIYP